MIQITLGEALANAISEHKLGNLAEAERLYRLIINAQPNHAISNHNLGILLFQRGKLTQSLDFFKVALENGPTEYQFWKSYLDALIKCGKNFEANNLLKLAKKKKLPKRHLNHLQKKLSLAAEKHSVKSLDPPELVIHQLIELLNATSYKKLFSKIFVLEDEYPRSAILNNIAGVASAKTGQYGTAIKYYQKALKLKPKFAEVSNNLGNAYNDLELTDKAISSYTTAIESDPTLVEPYFNLGNMLALSGDLHGAIHKFKAAIHLRSNYPEAYLGMANAEKKLHNYHGAKENYMIAIELRPQFLEAYVNLASLYLDMDQAESAYHWCHKAVEIAPNSSEALNNFGLCLKQMGEHEQAEDNYKKAINNKPDFKEALNNLASLLREIGRHAEAKYNLRKALRIQPDYAEALKNFGVVYQDLGQRELAVDYFKKAIAKKPNYSDAHRHLSILVDYRTDELHLSEMEDQLRTATFTAVETSQMKYAVAKAYEDLGQLETAFSYYTEAGQIRKKYLNYTIGQDRAHFKNIKKAQINLPAISDLKKFEKSSIIPIFIVGMPRSGTSLVEQIISCHSEVHGAGELEYLVRFSKPIFEKHGNIGSEMLLSIRNQYLKKLDVLGASQKYVTDKMPENYKLIPIITAAFPEAKIVHVRRNPEATCWSNFKHYFVGSGMRYSYDINDVAEAYLLYFDLMLDWEKKFPNKIITCDYDELTEHQEVVTKRLIGSLGLSWEETCLEPHKNKRFVNTASQHQVRKKIYKKSSREWIKYSKLIGASFKRLSGIK